MALFASCPPLLVFTLVTCAFCFRTSAGVIMRQATISAEEDEMAWMMGCGRECVKGRGLLSGLWWCLDAFIRVYLTAS
jgi:hypothetical protein